MLITGVPMKVWRDTDAKLSRETKARSSLDAWSMLLAMLKHCLEHASSSAQAVLKHAEGLPYAGGARDLWRA
jgi:hypothetical protein